MFSVRSNCCSNTEINKNQLTVDLCRKLQIQKAKTIMGNQILKYDVVYAQIHEESTTIHNLEPG